VLPPEQNRNGAALGERQKVCSRLTWRHDVSLGGASASGESRDSHDTLERFLDILAASDSLNDIVGAVSDTSQAPRIVFHGPHQIQIRAAHVLHRANGCSDVYGILGLVEN